ncbi:hypothetical protein MCHI_000532 [Candidatus Magnetoovum chiemensis]|nr:hypothetical protein MCHI_000532 [Candidatus Magnetoovum chiemensis]
MGSSVFDYSVIDVKTADEIKASAERIKLRIRRTVEDVVEIGKELVIVKEKLGHGKFEEWITANFDMNIRTAQNFMSVYNRFGGKNETVSFLPLRALYELSSSSTPDEIVDMVIEKFQEGGSITVQEIKRWKQAVKDAQEKSLEYKSGLEIASLQISNLKQAKEKYEAEIMQLNEKLRQLRSLEPIVEIKEIVPEGYITAKDAENAVKQDITRLNIQKESLIGEIESIRAEEEDYLSRRDFIMKKRREYMVFKGSILKVLANCKELPILLHSDWADDIIINDLKATKSYLLELVALIEKSLTTYSADIVEINSNEVTDHEQV